MVKYLFNIYKALDGNTLHTERKKSGTDRNILRRADQSTRLGLRLKEEEKRRPPPSGNS